MEEAGTLNVSQPYGPPWPGKGIALPFFYGRSGRGLIFYTIPELAGKTEEDNRNII
jgi:hypothetical protein